MLRATPWAAATAAALGVGALALMLPGCLGSPDCGVCDKDNLVLTSISGPNYTGDLVHLVSPPCKGDDCPSAFDDAKYFLDAIGPCIESDAAIDAADAFPNGAEEYCKIAPIVVSSGLQFIFNNLLEPKTIELIRKRPDNASVYETYEWRTRILSVTGPGTRYSGDWRHDIANDVERVTRSVNLSCADNQAGYTHDDYEDPASNPCNAAENRDAALWPAKMADDQMFTAPRGRWDDRALGEASEFDCDDPQEGADTCCSLCDFVLTSQVAKYGLAPSEHAGDELPIEVVGPLLARPGTTAITCDPDDDRLVGCRGFEPWTSRRNETLELFWPKDCWKQSDQDSCDARNDDCTWDADTQACVGTRHGITWEDHLRELHPADRGDVEHANAACTTTAECRDPAQRALPGTECVGTDDEGRHCAVDAGDPTCTEGRCIAEWFVACRADAATTGAQGYCVDVRHDADAAPGCSVAQDCDKGGLGTCTSVEIDARISTCGDGDGRLTAEACCKDGEPCDPTYAGNVDQLHAYERNDALPGRTRDCRCDDVDEPGCTSVDDDPDVEPDDPEYNVITQTCDAEPSGAVEDDHDYAVNFVTRLGGVIYDPALKGVQWRPADLGNMPRAAIEMCAEQRGLIDPRNIDDGWRAHDAQGITSETHEDFDRGMCSGQTYTVVFATGDDEEVLRDKVDNTLAGKATYTFETPQFHVVPGSGFPSDALRIGACDEFTLQFSNKYDLSPENLTKLEIRDGDTVVAGGPSCAATSAEVGPGRPPCLLVNVAEHHLGRIGARVDPIVFGPVLQEGITYELVVPGIRDVDDVLPDEEGGETGEAYYAAFWDVCGMPLVLSGDEDDDGFSPFTIYEFTVDPASCRDDADGDGIPRSCDNADDTPNPGQSDLDADGFGDAADPCPTLATAGPETGDSDRDGIGNACDGCASAPDRYNENALAASLPAYLYTRNVPAQADADRDGIADVCDNCPTVANCGTYGPDTPHRQGIELPTDEDECQTDDEDDLVGDACQGLETDGAAGPIGFGPADDFDQDGVANLDDACPRQPIADRVTCGDASECDAGRVCEGLLGDAAAGVCDHLDSDGDGVGDECDSCPYVENATQVFDGGAQEDDPDGDFVGTDCELDDACSTEHGPRPIGFYEVAVAGQCCVTALRDDGGALVVVATDQPLLDPDGLPVRLDCDDDGGTCRTLPADVAALPGVLVAPSGCTEALADVGIDDPSTTPRLSAKDTDGDLDALWARACVLPPSDLDFDGIGDACDLCIFGFDPKNTPYTDEQGKLWPHDGDVCSGSRAGVCEDEGESEDEGETDAGESDDGVDAGTDDAGSSTG